ncbi:MAG: ATP-binding protein [Anaerolineales bacterium]|nr:ATP-binding protein [Anaerolineales bacterium]
MLAGAIALFAGLSVWAVWNSGRRVEELQRRLTDAHLARFRLADEFQRRLLALNNSMLRFAVRREPALWSEFERASHDLDQWLDEQSSQLHTERERDLLQQLNAAYDSYVQAARQVQATRPPVEVHPQVFPDITEFESKADRLLALGQQLAEAHGEAREGFLSQANAQLGHLRFLLFGSAGMSLALMGGLGWFVYRDLIAPLRTRLVQSEVVLERQGKLATLGTLAAGIAHEIRNPLTSIKARLYTLAKHIKGNDAALSDTMMIGDEIARLERIVQDVLRFARPSEPQFKVMRADTPLREVHSLMAAALEQKQIRLTLDSQTEQLVSMDVALIKQVLVNLVRNAAEAIEQEGTVTLRARASQTKLNGRVQEVAVLEVADTGKGIPPEVEKRLFDPFFSTKEAGTGLGLSIAARIVDKHGGALQYRTQVGRGTTFGIVLPIAQGPVENPDP